MDTPSYSFNHVCIPPQTQISLHTQESWELSHIVTGSGRHIIGGKTEPFSSGEVVYELNADAPVQPAMLTRPKLAAEAPSRPRKRRLLNEYFSSIG